MKSITKLALIATSIFAIACSKSNSDENPVAPVPDNSLLLTKTERNVAIPPQNITEFHWIAQKGDNFYIHLDGVNKMFLYDMATNTFVNKTASPNVNPSGFSSQFVMENLAGGRINYLANDSVGYEIATDTWTPNLIPYPANIRANNAEAKTCVIQSLGQIYYIGGRMNCKTVKYYYWSTSTWNSAADYPITISNGPELAVDQSSKIIYALGGNIDTAYSKEFFKYTKSTNSWQKLADAPIEVARSYMTGCMVFYKNKYVVYCGKDFKLYVYDIETNKWQTNGVATGVPFTPQLNVSADGSKIFLLYRKTTGALGIQEYK